MGKGFDFGDIEWKYLIGGLVLGVVVMYFAQGFFVEKPIPPRVEYITIDANHCTAEYARTEVCPDIKVCSMKSKQGNFGMEYWCECW